MQTGISLSPGTMTASHAPTNSASLEVVFSSTAFAVISMNRDGRVQAWNPGAVLLFGYSAAEIMGLHAGSLVWLDSGALRSMIETLREGTTYVQGGMARLAKGRDVVLLSSTWLPVFDTEGELTGVVEITPVELEPSRRLETRALEALRAQNTALQRTNLELEQFAYAVSHDLQEPVRNFVIYAQLLASRYGSRLDEKGQQYLSFATESALRMQKLVYDLLQYVQVASISPSVAETADAEAAVHDVITDLRSLIAETGAEITVASLPPVRVPAVHLRQLFANLLENGIKYRSAAPPRISVHSATEGELVRFLVEDNGIGIHAEDIDHIFQLFKRGAPENPAPGTGIGLAICRRIVERAGGSIGVTSQHGEGSRFHFTLPAG